MPKVRDAGRELGDRVTEALALTALGEAALKRDADAARAQELVDEALALLAPDGRPGRSLRRTHRPRHDRRVARRHGRGLRALHGAGVRAGDGRRPQGPPDDRRAGTRADAHHPASSSTRRSSCSRARSSSRERAGASALGSARRSRTAGSSTVKGELAAAETVFEEVRQTADELGVEPGVAAALMRLGDVAWRRRDYQRAEKLYPRGAQDHVHTRRSRACCRISTRRWPRRWR